MFEQVGRVNLFLESWQFLKTQGDLSALTHLLALALAIIGGLI